MTRSQIERIVRIHDQLGALAREVMSDGERKAVEAAQAQLGTLSPWDSVVVREVSFLLPRWRGDEAEAEGLLAAFDEERRRGRPPG